jgi:hypothetical protein
MDMCLLEVFLVCACLGVKLIEVYQDFYDLSAIFIP